MYETLEDAQLRLDHTVILYNGHPVYVRGVQQNNGDSIKLRIFQLPDVKKEVLLDINDPGFRSRDFSLGYMNSFDYGAMHISRMPARRQRQGLSHENVFIAHPFIRFADILKQPGLVEMCRNRYPSIDEAIYLAPKTGAKSIDYHGQALKKVAFHRCFAVAQDMEALFKLEYRGEMVGFTADNGRTFRLSDNFKHISESLETIGVGLA